MKGALSLLPWILLIANCSKGVDSAAEPTASPPAHEPTSVQTRHISQTPDTEVLFETATGEQRVALEVVGTPALVQRGLMYRRHLAPDRGMLFIFAGDRVRRFWMKNTLIPLDILFVRSDLTVAGISRDAVPLSLDSRTVGIATQYVIEVNGGWSAAHGVEAGTKLRFEHLPRFENPPL